MEGINTSGHATKLWGGLGQVIEPPSRATFLSSLYTSVQRLSSLHPSHLALSYRAKEWQDRTQTQFFAIH